MKHVDIRSPPEPVKIVRLRVNMLEDILVDGQWSMFNGQ